MDTFKHKSRGLEKFWLICVITIFLELVMLSISNIFFDSIIQKNKYSIWLLIPIVMIMVNLLFIKSERFLEYGFTESYKGYLILIVLFLMMIYLMIQVKPISS